MNRQNFDNTALHGDDDLGAADLGDENLDEDEEVGGVSGRSAGSGSSTGVLDDSDLGDENTDTE